MNLKDFKKLIETVKIIDSVRIIIANDTGDLNSINVLCRESGIKFRTICRNTNPTSFKRRTREGLIVYHIHFYLLEDSKFYRIKYSQNIKDQPKYLRASDFLEWTKNVKLKNKLDLLCK